MSVSYHFAEYRLNPALRELWRADQLLVLPPHVFDCLAYLVERHERAVGRDELVAAVWGRTEISDTLLGQTVLRIRRELGDDAKAQNMLRTIPRFGYRWVAPLDIADSTEVSPPESNAQIPEVAALPPRSRVTITTAAIAAFAIVAVLSAGFWAWRSHHLVSATPVSNISALTSAVLPAAVESGSEWAWMRLGIMDIVAGRLRSSGLPSVPSEAVVTLLNAPEANRSGTLRDALAARLLVTPHVRQVDSNWQIDLSADDGAGQRFAVSSQSRDPTAAARDAADKLLVALGRQPPAASAEAEPDAILIKRIDAAVLADDPDGARTLIAKASPEQNQLPEVRLRLAKMDFRSGKLDAARERLHGLLDEAPAKTEPVLRASVLNGLGAVAIRSNKPQQAAQAFGEAISLLESQQEPAQLGQAYLGRAAAATDERRFGPASSDYARARIAFRQANDTLALIRVSADEGFLDLEQGRPAQALPQLATATDGFKRWGALNEAILTFIGQLQCDLDLLDNRAAMQVADMAAALAQRIDNPATLASLDLARASALVAAGRIHEARDTLNRLRSAPFDPATAANAEVTLARVDLDSGNFASAADLAEHAVTVLDSANYAAARAGAWLTAIRAELHLGNPTKANDAMRGLDVWARRVDDPRVRLYASLAQAEYARRHGSAAQWRQAFADARDLAMHDAVPADISEVARSFADALLADHDTAAAAVEVGRVSRWSDQDFDCAVLEARLYAALGRNEARQTAVARARALAGERKIPADALSIPISNGAAAH
ncbi:MAG: winged helix-turn-helix domain-containing protein [Rudaea sp.]